MATVAAHGLLVALRTAGEVLDDGRARKADERVDVLNDDADAREDRRRGGVAGLLDGVAALERTRAAGLGERGGGGGEDCGCGEELGEHPGFFEVMLVLNDWWVLFAGEEGGGR